MSVRLFAPIVLVAIAVSSIGAASHVAAPAPDAPTCSGKKPCLVIKNGKNGPAILATSVSGFALEARSHLGSGVYGATYDPTGFTFTTGSGVFGIDLSSDQSGLDSGVQGATVYGTGVFGNTSNPSKTTGIPSAGVVGEDYSGDYGQLNIGVEGVSYGTGVIAFSNGPGHPAGQQQFPALYAICAGGGLAMLAGNGFISPEGDLMSLDCAGNMILKGSVVTDGMPLIRVGTPSQPPRAAYAAEEAAPAIEDVGEGRMTNGDASVTIDQRFVASMDAARGYSVFITPEGPSLGLYVTSKTARGFEVRENPGGHSNLAFAYRIVATPAGAPLDRLPAMHDVVGTLYREGNEAPHNPSPPRSLVGQVQKMRPLRHD